MLFRIGDAVAHRDVHAAVFDARYLFSASGSEPGQLEGSSTGWPRR
jgi:hypothetical protein